MAWVLAENRVSTRVKASYRWLLILAPVLAAGGFLLTSALVFRIGFPLDDAWIHQTYARNLGQVGEWAYVPGQPSAGSTSPLWSILLTGGYLLFANIPYFWTYLLGTASLVVLAWTGELLFRRLLPDWKNAVPWMGLFLAIEWHLVWASVSGMETPLAALLILIVLFLVIRSHQNGWLIGLLIGLSVWGRPDTVTLLGPATMVIVLDSTAWKEKWISTAKVGAGFLLLFLPYLLFNHQLAGTWWPNTFYAKQTEYAALQQIPLLVRYGRILALPAIGAGALLVPGFLFFAWRAAQGKNWPVISAYLWWLGYSLIYAMRLPVTYQHGRYLMPAMPVFFVLGFVGTVLIIQRYLVGRSYRRIIRRVWLLSIAAVTAAFYLVGATTYAQDVAIIETEMVDTARWVAQNTNPEDLFAVHDIGAFGYFTNRKFIDLAGLVSPEVIPFLRDETKLANYLDQQQVRYLVTFPSWYPELSKQGEIVFQTGGKFAPAQGNDNMAVIRWRRFEP